MAELLLARKIKLASFYCCCWVFFRISYVTVRNHVFIVIEMELCVEEMMLCVSEGNFRGLNKSK